MPTSRRIGLFGGTYDPVHLGHLLIAQDVYEQAELDAVWFVPAGQNPLKNRGPQVDGAGRLAMLVAAVAEDPRFAAVDEDIMRPGPSYAVDTLRGLKEKHPDCCFHFIIGEDNLDTLGDWNRAEELVGETEFLVCSRPGSRAGANLTLPGLRWQRVENRLLDISATEIRDRMARGLSVDFFLPERVLSLIRDRGYYQSAGSADETANQV